MTTPDMFEAAFTAGYYYGAKHKRPASPAEADGALRAAGLAATEGCVACYCNGSDDGAIGDTWRLGYPRRETAPADRA